MIVFDDNAFHIKVKGDIAQVGKTNANGTVRLFKSKLDRSRNHKVQLGHL